MEFCWYLSESKDPKCEPMETKNPPRFTFTFENLNLKVGESYLFYLQTLGCEKRCSTPSDTQFFQMGIFNLILYIIFKFCLKR